MLAFAGCSSIEYNNDPYNDLQPKWFIVTGDTTVSGPYKSEEKCAGAKFASGEWNDDRSCVLLK